ncbi:MAG: hypothetical protein HY584_00830 [Candidatus Omnitrophica bacterium]|nr:hypothetical protein [Candidatus Omnitrophota bacterium]
MRGAKRRSNPDLEIASPYRPYGTARPGARPALGQAAASFGMLPRNDGEEFYGSRILTREKMVSPLVDHLRLVCYDWTFWTSFSLEIKGFQPFLEMVLDDRDLCADPYPDLEQLGIDQADDRSIQKLRVDLSG